MQSSYAESFQRDVGCTEAEWLGWLPAAVGDRPWTLGAGHAEVEVQPGTLQLRWQAMPPRVIALMRMPILRVNFEFAGLDDAERYAFMKRFDLYMQRGGG
jgi:hypothetical protein